MIISSFPHQFWLFSLRYLHASDSSCPLEPKLPIWMQVHWLMCHMNTFMCQNAAATHVSLKCYWYSYLRKSIFSMPGNRKKMCHKICHSVKQVLLVKLQRGKNQG